ncbi:MAG: DNRLRE domain-containing protein [Rhodopirellula sp. JB044]|uniref:DNRLRE domain-containing protein n=1 Tax=Rhodopirellula sp. JB044 TaxID=3342844 RepID=UPI00370B397D
MNPHDQTALCRIIERLVDDDLTEEDANWLNDLLKNDPEARTLFLDLTHDNAMLYLNWPQLEQHQNHNTLQSNPPSVSPVAHHAATGLRPYFWNGVSVLAVCTCILISAWFWSAPHQTTHAPFVATLTHSSNARWAESTLPTTVHTPLGPGRMRLKHGTCTLRYTSGVEVLLSGDVDFELIDSSTAKLHSGVAKAKIPKSLERFTINTPNASSAERGGEFSVTYNPSDRTSRIRVIAGKVSVRHQQTGKQRIAQKGEALEATHTDLLQADNSIPEGELRIPPQSNYLSDDTMRITTAMGRGGDATIIMSNDPTFLDPALITVKNCESEYRRKGYLRFDLTTIKGSNFKNAKLILTLQENHWASLRAPHDVLYSVFGVTDESLDGWSPEDLRWENAPANVDASDQVDESKARRLGSMLVIDGRATGQVLLQSNELNEFVNADTNGLVTLIVVRDSPVSSDEYSTPNGFASRRHNSQLPPTLEVQLVANEESI